MSIMSLQINSWIKNNHNSQLFIYLLGYNNRHPLSFCCSNNIYKCCIISFENIDKAVTENTHYDFIIINFKNKVEYLEKLFPYKLLKELPIYNDNKSFFFCILGNYFKVRRNITTLIPNFYIDILNYNYVQKR